MNLFTAITFLGQLSWLLDYSFAAYECNQRLYEAKGDPTTGSNGFTIEINGHSDKGDTSPTGYVPGKTYKVALRGWQTQYVVQTFRGFGITGQFENGKPAGKFDVKKVSSTRVP